MTITKKKIIIKIMKNIFSTYFLLICSIFLPFAAIADKQVYECRFYVKKFERYHTNKITFDTWAMNGTIQNTTPFIKNIDVKYGSLVKYKEAYMLTIDQKPLLVENHLINPIKGELKYLIEVTFYNILGKTPEEKKQITVRDHLSGDCRTLK